MFPKRTTAEWDQRLRAEDQRHAVVRDHAAVAEDPQVYANGYLQEVDLPDSGGRVRTVGNPLRLSRTPAVPGVAPELGQHTEEVLLEAGFTWDEIGELRAAGAR